MLSNPTCNSCSVYLTLQELLSKLTFLFSLNPTFFWLLSYYRPSVLPLSQELGPSLLVVLDFRRSNRFPTESPRWPRCILLGKRVKKCTFPNSNLENKRSHLKYIELKAEHLAFLLCVLSASLFNTIKPNLDMILKRHHMYGTWIHGLMELAESHNGWNKTSRRIRGTNAGPSTFPPKSISKQSLTLGKVEKILGSLGVGRHNMKTVLWKKLSWSKAELVMSCY